MVSEQLSYKDCFGVDLCGLLIRESNQRLESAVIMFSDIRGIHPGIRRQAERFAALAHAVLIADMHGGGSELAPQQGLAAKQVLIADPQLLRARARAAFDAIRVATGLSANRVCAIGYCFGGLIALELARDGAELAAAASLHGELKPAGAPMKTAATAVLTYTGSIDPMIPREQVDKFRDEVEAAGCPWQIVVHGGVGHAFTDPGANGQRPGFAYDKAADCQSFALVREFFDVRLK